MAIHTGSTCQRADRQTRAVFRVGVPIGLRSGGGSGEPLNLNPSLIISDNDNRSESQDQKVI